MTAMIAELPSGVAPWYVDNTTALGWGKRSWSPRAEHNAMVVRTSRECERRRVEVPLRWTPGGDANMVDVLTRPVDGVALLGAGARWSRKARIACSCEGPCEHAREVIRSVAYGV